MRIRQSSLAIPQGAGSLFSPAPAAAPRLSAEWVHAQFCRTDDGAGGRLQTLRRGFKFWVRCWWNERALAMSTAALSEGALDSITQTTPELALRPLRSYLRRGLGPMRRAQAVREHFGWLAQHVSTGLIERLYAGESVAVLGACDAVVAGLGVSLAGASGLGREGEFALHLEWQGTRVMSLAFSVLDASRVVSAADPVHAAGRRIVIGSLQGVRGAEAALREMSSAAQRLRPSALLVLAVQGLSAAWGLEAPLGVAAESHVYAGYASRRRKVAIDYDAAWQGADAERTGRHYWTLPPAPLLRPDTEVESRRRASHRRRNALRQSLLAAVRDRAELLMA
jgi:uncharacterized protein